MNDDFAYHPRAIEDMLRALRSGLATVALLVAEEAATLVSAGYRAHPAVDKKAATTS